MGDASEPGLSTYRGNDEARALGVALLRATERGERVPCDDLDPSTVRPSTCTACPLAVREACGDYGRASGLVGTFGGVRLRANYSRRTTPAENQPTNVAAS